LHEKPYVFILKIWLKNSYGGGLFAEFGKINDLLEENNEILGYK